MRTHRISIATGATLLCFAALTSIALANTVGYTADPTDGNILTTLGFNSNIDLTKITQMIAGPVAFMTFMGGALHAANKIQQSQGHWHELIHSGATTGFLGIMLGGAGMYWSKTHAVSGALIAAAHQHVQQLLK